MDYFLKGLREYANFSGREQRRDYWMFVLIYFLISIGLSLLDSALGITLLTSLFALVMLIPSLSYAARRLHDTGRSGWWQLLYLIPVIGLIVVIIFLVLDSDRGDNQYGPSPKYPMVRARRVGRGRLYIDRPLIHAFIFSANAKSRSDIPFASWVTRWISTRLYTLDYSG
jgi:uncharacterized membrane protein YhaH (DUF805 family)